MILAANLVIMDDKFPKHSNWNYNVIPPGNCRRQSE
jgi:hypothetical protein